MLLNLIQVGKSTNEICLAFTISNLMLLSNETYLKD